MARRLLACFQLSWPRSAALGRLPRRPGPRSGPRHAGRRAEAPLPPRMPSGRWTSPEQVTPAAKPPLEITPGSSTITADDPGLQLLAARKEAGSIRDLTGRRQVERRAGRSGRDRAGGVSPAACSR